MFNDSLECELSYAIRNHNSIIRLYTHISREINRDMRNDPELFKELVTSKLLDTRMEDKVDLLKTIVSDLNRIAKNIYDDDSLFDLNELTKQLNKKEFVNDQ